jgi:hypothetical protein
MKWPFQKQSPTGAEGDPVYYLTYRMQTGGGRSQASSKAGLPLLRAELQLAGASDITVVDIDGKLVIFDS